MFIGQLELILVLFIYHYKHNPGPYYSHHRKLFTEYLFSFFSCYFFFALCASESALNRETDWFFCLLFSSLFPRLRHWKCLWNFYGDVGHHADDCLVFEVFSSKTKLISSPLGLDWRVGCLYCISTQYYYTTYILYYRDVVRCPLPACPCRLRMFILNCTKNQSP